MEIDGAFTTKSRGLGNVQRAEMLLRAGEAGRLGAEPGKFCISVRACVVAVFARQRLGGQQCSKALLPLLLGH